MPPVPRKPKKIAPLIVSGPGRPAPIKKQPLPAYGPYALPLTDVEKRIVINKRTPKFVETPSGRIATGGGGVGFFTKGDKAPIMSRVRDRALAREADIRSDRERLSKPAAAPIREAVKEVKKQESKPNFLESLADDVGLDDFYVDNVIPVMGRAFGRFFEDTKETYGANLVSPAVVIARGAASAVGQEDKIDEPFDYAANLVRGGVGIAKTQGFDRAKPYVKPVVEGVSAMGKASIAPLVKIDDFLETEVPIYDSSKEWVSRNAVKPSKDAATEILSRVTGQPISQRIGKADEFDRNFVFLANDITQRGAERESAAPQERRDVWIQMALGEYDDPAWDGYKSPFTREQLNRMSDYELANAAYGTHTSGIASLFEAAKNDIKKIGAMPALLGAFADQIEDAKSKGDYRGLGNMAEFLVRQGVSNMVALSKANIYVVSGGQAGNYQDLVRALQAEPILTGLDVAATATIYGKAATFGLKTGGALTKAGALAGRVPGATGVGGRIARGAERAAYRMEGPASGIGPEARVPTTFGAPLRAAASTGRGLRKIADTDVVEVFDPEFNAIGSVAGATVGADRTFRPTSSFFSKASALLRKKLYEGTNPFSRTIFNRGVVSDTKSFRAMSSSVIELLGDQYAAPVVKMLKDIFDESPDLALRVVYDLQGPDSLTLPSGRLGGDTVKLTPGARADELQSVLDGKLWVRRKGDQSPDDAFRFSDESPGIAWKQVTTDNKDLPDGAVIKLDEVQVSNIEQNILILRRIDGFSDDVVARARERLEAPYREQFGETIGKRIGARNSPDGSGVDLLQLQELQSIRNLDSLGVDIDRRVANISPDLQARLTSKLNIGLPTGSDRRTFAGVARLQDETYVRLVPLVGDKFRAEVEKILNEELAKAENIISDSEMRIEVYKGSEGLARKSEIYLEELKAEVALINERLGVLDASDPEKIALTAGEASGVADEYVSFWKKIFNKFGDDTDATFSNIENVLEENPYITASQVLDDKTGDATGSNTGGKSGFWTGSDGKKRYVKEYDSFQQGIGEVVANKIYRALGILVPESHLIVGDDSVTGVANDIVNKQMSSLGGTILGDTGNAGAVLDGVVADIWIANWDAVGIGSENIILNTAGIPVRIDQGGALFHRAQGELKPQESLTNFSIEDLVTQNPEYAAVIRAAGYENVKDIPGIQDQLARIVDMVDSYGGIDNFVDKLMVSFSSEMRVNYANLLNTRLASLKKQIGLPKGYKKNSPKKSKAKVISKEEFELARDSLDNYMGWGHTPINNALRREGGLNLNIEDATIRERITDIDRLIEESPPTTAPMVLYRGAIPIKDDLIAGDTLTDNGFLSTSFILSKAEEFGDINNANGAVVEIYVPAGSKGLYGNAVRYVTSSDPKSGLTPEGFPPGEHEFILPRGTQFYVIDVDDYSSGAKIARVYAITPDSKFSVEDIPEFGGERQATILQRRLRQNPNKLKAAEVDRDKFAERAALLPEAEKALEKAKADHKSINKALADIDMVAESLMRDWIESGEVSTGARVFIPTLDGQKGAKKVPFPRESLGSRGRPRDLLDIYTGQFAMLGSVEDLQRFSGVLARSLRLPFVAFESVTRFTDYLMRTGATIKFSDDAKLFEKQKKEILASGFLNNNGETASDYVVLPVNSKTGFLDQENLNLLDFNEEVGTVGRSDVSIDDAQIAAVFDKALEKNAIQNLDSIPAGSQVVIISRKRFDVLRKEMQEAAKSPGLLRRITRQWVRFTLTTLPRTPIANVVGSGLLSMLGGGLAGYPEAMRSIRRGDAPPELMSNGLAGSFNEGGDLVIAPEGGKFRGAQRYMNYMYYFNVMGEDLARLATFMEQAKKGIKNKNTRAKIDAELKEAMELNDSFQTLLEAVARGEFANGKALTPELIRIRDGALSKADDFLGGSRGLTSGQRTITSIVPFWMWYKHIFKLYFYTLPFKYPGRALALNAMARLGAEESAQNGFYDSFYEDAVKFSEEVIGSNTYAKGFTSNIYPFNFGGALEYDEAAPGVQFALSSIAPTITLPARLAGIGVPGAPIIGAGGERLRPGDVFAPGYAEAAVSEAEKLFAPLGLIQSTVAPRSSLAFDAYRLATGQPLPEAQQRGEGEQYAVTPRGFSGLGLPQSVLEMFMRSFGVGIARTPVRGPVADRRILSEQQRLEEEARKRYRESLGLDY